MSVSPAVSLASATDNRTEPSDLAAVHARIVSPELADLTACIRAESDRDKRNAIKRRLPAFIAAGLFSLRKSSAWTQASGLLPCDFDKVPDLDRLLAGLAADLCVALLFRSPSGDGAKAVLRVPVDSPDPAQHARAFEAAQRWARESHGAELDPSGRDPARLAYLCADPAALLRLDAVPLDLDRWAPPEPKPKPEPRREAPPGDVVRRAAAYLDRLPPSIAGQGGHAALFRAAVALVWGFDLSDSVALPLLERFNLRADPPWSAADLARKLTEARSVQHREPCGWLLNAEPDRAEARAATDPWPPAVPIRSAAEPPPFDLLAMIPRALPELADLVDAGAEALQVPRELIAGVAVGLAALACARAVEIELAPGWREPGPLWVLPLLRPGERKSAAMSMLSRPFNEWAQAERKRLAEPLARYAERRRCMEAELAAFRAKSAKGCAESQAAALDLAAELDAMPARLAAPDLLVQSYTPEGLRDLLETNGEKLGIVSAEADAAELMGSRYSDAGPCFDLLLSAHAGDPITTRRAGGRVVPLDRPAVGLVLAIQPEAVRSVLADRAAKGRGLIDRMLLILPPSRLGSRTLDPAPVPREVADWWASAIGRLLNLPWAGRCILGHDGEPTRCTSQPRILTIDPEARRILWDLRGNLEPRLAEGADLAAVSGFASKLPGACARLALALAMLRDPGAEVVDGEAMRAACAWAPFLLGHHRAVLGEAAEPSEAHHARRLWRAIQRRGRATMTARELFDLVRDSAVPTMADFRPVLDLLREHDAIRQAAGETGSRGRPAELWEINPAILPRDLRDKSEGMEGAA